LELHALARGRAPRAARVVLLVEAVEAAGKAQHRAEGRGLLEPEVPPSVRERSERGGRGGCEGGGRRADGRVVGIRSHRRSSSANARGRGASRGGMLPAPGTGPSRGRAKAPDRRNASGAARRGAASA